MENRGGITMAKPIEVAAQTFKEEVLRSKIPVAADFYADWCMPCRMLAPLLEALAEEFAGRVKFAKVNVEREFLLADQYQIRGVPTLILFKEGTISDVIVGLPAIGALRAQLERIIGSEPGRVSSGVSFRGSQRW